MTDSRTERCSIHKEWDDAISRCVLTIGPVGKDYMHHSIVWQTFEDGTIYSEVEGDFMKRLEEMEKLGVTRDNDPAIWFKVNQLF